MTRVLLLGSSGWLGGAVAPLFRDRFDLHAPRSAALDLRDAAAVGAAFAAVVPDVVVNLAALQPAGGDERGMAAVNVEGARHVAACAAASGARLLHMSTDLVLDGRAAPYRDDAPASPVNAYGRTKAAGETAVRDACPDALILRTSLVFDPRVAERFTVGVMDRLARGEPASLFTDEMRCPVARGTLALALAELCERRDVTGMLQIAGTQPLSRFDFGMRLLRRFGATRLDLVRPALAARAAEPRPLDLTLDVTKARGVLATPLRSVDEELTAAGPGPGHA